MAAGPIAKALAQAVVLGVSILVRALPAAYGAALQNAKKAGGNAAKDATKSGASFLGKAKMSREEAIQVLNLTEGEITAESVRRQYERYFAANAVEKGGSFYLQSKVYRAKELLDEFERDKNMEENEEAKKGEREEEEEEGRRRRRREEERGGGTTT